jgi:uncharacterized membrane protein YraQ (UPF0718 family)
MNIITLLETTFHNVLLTFAHNWPYLLASILIGSLIKLFLDKDKVAAFLQKHQKGGVGLATAVAVGTPLCSCGTTAIVIGMMASMMPWAPIVAFMVASPLSSPEGMVYTAGLFGWPFAIAGFIGSIILGLGGGAIAAVFERAGLLKNQFRFDPTKVAKSEPVRETLIERAAAQPSCGCSSATVMLLQPVKAESACSCGGSQPAQSAQSASKPKITFAKIGQQLLHDGPKLLVMFFSFAFLGYLINGLVPAEWISRLFGAGYAYSVPLAATLGLPFYINGEGSLPLVRAMLDSGMSQGAALAFLISGSGTSIGAIAGALSIARWRVIAIVIGTLWAGAILLGIAFDVLLATGLI